MAFMEGSSGSLAPVFTRIQHQKFIEGYLDKPGAFWEQVPWTGEVQIERSQRPKECLEDKGKGEMEDGFSKLVMIP